MAKIVGRSPAVPSKKSITKQYRLAGTLDEVVEALSNLGHDDFYFNSGTDAAVKGIPLTIHPESGQLVCTLKTGPLAVERFQSAVQAFEGAFT